MDLNREVGELKTQAKHIMSELSDIKKDVKALLMFKWNILGFAGFAAFLATMIIEIIRPR